MNIAVLVPGDVTQPILRGGEAHALAVADGLARRGHDVRVICRGPEAHDRTIELGPHRVTVLARVRPPRLLWRLGRGEIVKPLARKLAPHLGGVEGIVSFWPWFAAAASRVAPALRRASVITTTLAACRAFQTGRDFDFAGCWLAKGFDATSEHRCLARHGGTLITLSHWMTAELQRAGIGASRMICARPGIVQTTALEKSSSRNLRGELAIGEEDLLVLFAGALTPLKQPLLLAEAIAQCPPGVHVLFAGGGPEASALHDRIDRLDIAGRAHCLGWTDAMASCYAAADVFCSASRFEGFGLGYLEAMRVGLALLGPRHDPPRVYNTLPELITPGREGLDFDATDPASLAEAINALNADRDKLAAMQLAAARRAEDFTWGPHVDAIEQALTAQPGGAT
jgi:glycosyltransferase involved in cell wall biosynthesis